MTIDTPAGADAPDFAAVARGITDKLNADWEVFEHDPRRPYLATDTREDCEAAIIEALKVAAGQRQPVAVLRADLQMIGDKLLKAVEAIGDNKLVLSPAAKPETAERDALQEVADRNKAKVAELEKRTPIVLHWTDTNPETGERSDNSYAAVTDSALAARVAELERELDEARAGIPATVDQCALRDARAAALAANLQRNEMAAKAAELAAALRDVLERDAEWAPSGMPDDCNCMSLSSFAEGEYEGGRCPHQLARAALADAGAKE